MLRRSFLVVASSVVPGPGSAKSAKDSVTQQCSAFAVDFVAPPGPCPQTRHPRLTLPGHEWLLDAGSACMCWFQKGPQCANTNVSSDIKWQGLRCMIHPDGKEAHDRKVSKHISERATYMWDPCGALILHGCGWTHQLHAGHSFLPTLSYTPSSAMYIKLAAWVRIDNCIASLLVWSVWSLAGTERCNHSAGLQERYHKRSSANSKVKLPVHCSQPQSISRDHGFVWFCCINACPSVPKCYPVTTCFLELWEYEGKGVIWLGESGIFLSFSCRSVWVRQIWWTDTLQVANESLPGVGIWRIASRNSSIIWGQSINCT